MNKRLRLGASEVQGRLLPKAAMPRPELEAGLMKRILATLQDLGVFAWRNHVGAVRIGGRYQRFGTPGSADIFAVVNGRLVGIECKRLSTQRPTPEQAAWGRRLELAGGRYVVAWSVEMAIVPVLEMLGEASR